MDGTVVDFDEDAGFGHIATEDGGRLFFHCAQIADGTRTIRVGEAVSFEVAAGHRGQWEAHAVCRRE